MEATPFANTDVHGETNSAQYGSMTYHPETEAHEQKKWPAMFWFILKFLCLFSHRSLVTERRCYICNMKLAIEERKRIADWNESSTDDTDYLAIAYERRGRSGEDTSNAHQTEDRPACEACESLWWNGNRVPVIYNENDIGVRSWNHKGSNVLAAVTLSIGLLALLCTVMYILNTLWGDHANIVLMVTKITYAITLAIVPTMCLCSKLRSCARNGLATNWAFLTTLNVRYLIVRAQMLDLPRRGLPGKPFLFLCPCCLTLPAVYRAVVYLFIGECRITLYIITTSLVVVFLTLYNSLILYILYIVRISFQRQLKLVLYYIKENEGTINKCRSVLFAAASDFGCFRQFCDVFALAAVPSFVFSLVVRIILDYVLYHGRIEKVIDEKMFRMEIHFSIIGWLNMVFAITMWSVSLGGLQVSYIWDNFFANLLRLNEGKFDPAWNKTLENSAYFVKGSQILLTSVCFSVISVYAGIRLSDQDISFNNTKHNLCG